MFSSLAQEQSSFSRKQKSGCDAGYKLRGLTMTRCKSFKLHTLVYDVSLIEGLGSLQQQYLLPFDYKKINLHYLS